MRQLCAVQSGIRQLSNVFWGKEKSILKPANEGKSHVLQLPQGSYVESSFHEAAAQVVGGTAVFSGEWKGAELL